MKVIASILRALLSAACGIARLALSAALSAAALLAALVWRYL